VLERIIAITWQRIEKAEAKGRTITLKLKHKDFTGLTRARSLNRPVASLTEFSAIGHALLDEVLPLAQPVRLVGLTLSGLEEDEPFTPPVGGNFQGELEF
jgi:DNA polymerase IV